MATIATLGVNVVARTQGFERNIRRSRQAARGFGSTLKTAGAGIASFGASLAGLVGIGVGVTAAIGSVSKALNEIDESAKLAARIGETTEAIEGLKLAAELTGAGSQLLVRSLDVLQKRLGESVNGVGQARRALDSLGLSAEELIEKSPAEQLSLIADRFRALPTQAQKAAAASDLFSRAGLKLVNLLDQGSEGLEKIREEAEALGITFSAEAAADVENFNGAVTKLNLAFRGFARQAVLAASESLTNFVNGITSAIKAFRGLGENVNLSAVRFGAFIAGFATFSLLLPTIATAVTAVVTTVVTLTRAFFSLGRALIIVQSVSPLGLLRVLAGLAGGIVTIGLVEAAFADMGDAAEKAGQQVSGAASQVQKFNTLPIPVRVFRTALAEVEPVADDLTKSLQKSIEAAEELARSDRSLEQLARLRGIFDIEASAQTRAFRERARITEEISKQTSLLEKQQRRVDEINKIFEKQRPEVEAGTRPSLDVDLLIEQGNLLEDNRILSRQLKRLADERLGSLQRINDELRISQSSQQQVVEDAEEFTKRLREGEKVIQSLRTPLEKFRDEFQRLQQLQEAGALGEGTTTLERGLARIRTELQKNLDVSKEQLSNFDEQIIKESVLARAARDTAEQRKRQTDEFLRSVQQTEDFLGRLQRINQAASRGILSAKQTAELTTATFEEASRQAKDLEKSLRTPQEIFDAEKRRLEFFRDFDLFEGADTFARAMEEARKNLEESTREVTKQRDIFREIEDRANALGGPLIAGSVEEFRFRALDRQRRAVLQQQGIFGATGAGGQQPLPGQTPPFIDGPPRPEGLEPDIPAFREEQSRRDRGTATENESLEVQKSQLTLLEEIRDNTTEQLIVNNLGLGAPV